MAPFRREAELNVNGAVLDRRCRVLDGHRGDRPSAKDGAGVSCGARRVADLEPRDGADPDDPTLDTTRPHLRVATISQSHKGGLVDQPVGHCHAAAITSGLPRSPKSVAKWCRS